MLKRKCDICGKEMRMTAPRYKVIFDGWLYTEKKDICTDCFKRIADEIKQADTPQTESTSSPIGDYRDGVGAWQTDCEDTSCPHFKNPDYSRCMRCKSQTDCDDRYAIRTDSGEVVAHACPLGCEQTDCQWQPNPASVDKRK